MTNYNKQNKTLSIRFPIFFDSHDLTEILFKAELYTIKQTKPSTFFSYTIKTISINTWIGTQNKQPYQRMTYTVYDKLQ
jgi:hypothetical protein